MMGSTSNSSITLAALTLITASSAFITASIIYQYRRALKQISQKKELISKLEETRLTERKGRIRAETKLRSHLKKVRADMLSVESLENREKSLNEKNDWTKLYSNLLLHCIGTVVSPYTKRMGTPRQGALVPSGRGYIQLNIPMECVEGLDSFSHAWVLFTFHANTDIPTPLKHSNADSMINLSKTKIRPPRGNGIKVGALATRSPHRPNNIGLSLVKVVRIDQKRKRLHIAGFDLVNGTPVYDIKPCVHWDQPCHHDKAPLMVPAWVCQDDTLTAVEFSSTALSSLKGHVLEGRLAPFYTCEDEGLKAATDTIREILAQDPRASNTNSTNKRGSKGSDMSFDCYKFLFCKVEIVFRVTIMGVTVDEICDINLHSVQHIDGLPILSLTGE